MNPESRDHRKQEAFGESQSLNGEDEIRPELDSEHEESKKKKRDPFKGMAPVKSSDSGMQGKSLRSRSEIKRLKKAGVRHEGKKVVTDDVKILKSLSVVPDLPDNPTDYYVEPVHIEYYIPKESRFAREVRYMYIPLIDPEPESEHRILQEHIRENRFLDLMNLMDEYPAHISDILSSYDNFMGMYEELSKSIREAAGGNHEMFRTAFYLCEVLADYEPTIASLEFLGEFISWDLNWLVRTMNHLGVQFNASDKTISYFIKRRNMYFEQNDIEYDERFEVLAALFYEQAFPNRGMEYQKDDFFYDIFDR